MTIAHCGVRVILLVTGIQIKDYLILSKVVSRRPTKKKGTHEILPKLKTPVVSQSGEWNYVEGILFRRNILNVLKV